MSLKAIHMKPEINNFPLFTTIPKSLVKAVQQVLEKSPHSGALFAFRGKRGDLVKLLWYDGQGLCLFSKRMDRGKFIWPVTKAGKVSLTSAQLSMLLEGIDWRRPERTAGPLLAG